MKLTTNGTLYTFGCSLTSYMWPTWADIIGKEFNKFENWGRPGAGNNFIFNSLIECLARNKITDNDLIIIMWSGICRIDYYQFNEWSHYHLMFDKKLPISCPYGAEIISYALFNAVDKLLSTLKIKFYMLSFQDYDLDSQAGLLYKNTLDKIIKLDFPLIEKEVVLSPKHKILDVYNRLAGSEWPSFDEIFTYNRSQYNDKINEEVNVFKKLINNNKHLYYKKTVKDTHPTPKEHLNTISTILDIKIKESTKEWVQEIEEKIRNKQSYFFEKLYPERL